MIDALRKRGAPTGILAGLALLLATGVVQDRVRAVGADAAALVPPPPQMIGLSIDPRIVRRLLGIRVVVADLIWIDTLIKSDITREPEPYTAFYRAFKKIAALDPDNIYAYYVAGMYLSVVKDDVKGATAILREGVRHMQDHAYVWTDAWKVPFTLGYNLMFEEHDVEEGGRWIQEAGRMPKSPQIVKTLAERVSTERGRLEIGSRVLNDLYRRLTNPEEKTRVEAKMLDFAARQELLDLNEKFEKFLSTTGAYAFPRKKRFDAFMRSTGHRGKDMLNRPLGINALGKIAPLQPASQ